MLHKFQHDWFLHSGNAREDGNFTIPCNIAAQATRLRGAGLQEVVRAGKHDAQRMLQHTQ